jgi:hypothetical protein
VAVEIDTAPSEGLQTSRKLEVIERFVKAALSDLACAPEHPRFLLLVDQLDQVWSNDPESDAMVTGLLLATKHVSSIFPGIRCVVFLRTDIYDLLQFAEGDKFHGDEMRIDWSPGSLLDLALARARASLGRPVTAEVLWGSLFSSNVAGKRISEYLIARTLMRPRDLIQFANQCRDTAEKNGHDIVTESDILEAEVQYSQWKLHDLGTEYNVNYPFLADLFTSFQNSGFIISRQSLEERFNVRLETLRNRFPELAPSLTLDNIIDILYGIGFLGVRRKLKTVYSYEDPARVEPGECQFYIHPCFRQALRSVTAADLQPYRIPTVFQELEILQNVVRLGAPEVRRGHQYARRSSIERSARRILLLLDHPQLAPEAAAEIGSPIREMLAYSDEVRVRLESGSIGEVEMSGYVRSTCNFLLDLARELQTGSIGDDLAIQTVARTMEDEARRLAEEARIRI